MTKAAANTEGSVAKTAAENVAVSVDESSSPDVAKALEAVQNIVAEVSKAFSAGQASAAGGETDTEKGKKKGKMPADESEPDEDDMQKGKAKKGNGLTGAAENSTAQPPVAKAAEQAALTMDSLVSAVTKAKAFTPDRIAKLKEAAEALKMLLDEVNIGQVPATATPPLKTSPGTGLEPAGTEGDPVVKALGAITDTLKTLTEKVTQLDGEVKAVKSAKPSPEGSTEGGTAVKTEKSSFWKSVV